jgi:hypothetical protein
VRELPRRSFFGLQWLADSDVVLEWENTEFLGVEYFNAGYNLPLLAWLWDCSFNAGSSTLNCKPKIEIKSPGGWASFLGTLRLVEPKYRLPACSQKSRQCSLLPRLPGLSPRLNSSESRLSHSKGSSAVTDIRSTINYRMHRG